MPAKKAAKKKTPAKKKTKSFEETLWDSANKLRGSVEPSEYKHVVLSLIFLKFASDKFEERRRELKDEGKGDYLETVEFYQMKNVFYLPEESRWSTIQANAKQDDLAIKIDTALHTIEKNNKSLAGALPDFECLNTASSSNSKSGYPRTTGLRNIFFKQPRSVYSNYRELRLAPKTKSRESIYEHFLYPEKHFIS